MKLYSETRTSRIYQSDVDPDLFTEVRLEVKGFYRVIERATYESHDPADKARIETVFTILRRELAVWGADQEELEFIGEPTRNTGTGWPDMEVEPDLFVPVVALILEQAYWPPAPTEEET